MSKYLEELEFILQHCNKRRNELIFMKCTSADCAHCLTHPVQNVAAMDLLRQRKGQFLSPMESPTHPGHSLTYIEAASLEPDKLAWPDPNINPLSRMLDLAGVLSAPPSHSFQKRRSASTFQLSTT